MHYLRCLKKCDLITDISKGVHSSTVNHKNCNHFSFDILLVETRIVAIKVIFDVLSEHMCTEDSKN